MSLAGLLHGLELGREVDEVEDLVRGVVEELEEVATRKVDALRRVGLVRLGVVHDDPLVWPLRAMRKRGYNIQILA